jgi:hypothetical protein
MSSRNLFIRNIEADTLRENLIVSAAATVFVIRIFLKLTHYPQLGGGAFHIAHIVWGGLFMVLSILILISFLSKTAANVASILGGIGFGFFIDEFGKFITSNNDYFFQPTVALIYIIFILLYLITKFIPHAHKITDKEYLINAIEMIKETAINDFDVEEEKRAREYLRKSDQDDPVVKAMASLLSKIDAIPAPRKSIYSRLRLKLREWYYVVAGSGFILNCVLIYLIVTTVVTLVQSGILITSSHTLRVQEWGKLYSSCLAGSFVLIGMFALRFSRAEAYRFFRIAMLITILLTEFFAFMHSQWLELVNLAANLFILLVINYAQQMEHHKIKAKRKLAIRH